LWPLRNVSSGAAPLQSTTTVDIAAKTDAKMPTKVATPSIGRRFEEVMYRTPTADGARVTLESVDADEEFVVVRFSVQDLKDDRRNAGNPAASSPS